MTVRGRPPVDIASRLGLAPDRPVRCLVLGAHPDDIEIGCHGLVRRLIAARPDAAITWAVMSGDGVRADEARASAERLLAPLETAARFELRDHRDGYFPYEAAAVKDSLMEFAPTDPDLLLAPRIDDAHQDHRLIGELSWQLFRRTTILEYEIPKYDGDLGSMNLYATLSPEDADAKVDHLLAAFPSQRGRGWFTADTFRGLLRLRGIECRAPSGLAEAFVCRKIVL